VTTDGPSYVNEELELEIEELKLKIRIYARELLLKEMKELCWKYHQTYWIANWSSILWETLVHKHQLGVAVNGFQASEIDGLRELFRDSGGWWYFSIGQAEPVFMRESEWRKLYGIARARGETV
jgi:hypothetical protein